jgi:hypothetical protein
MNEFLMQIFTLVIQQDFEGIKFIRLDGVYNETKFGICDISTTTDSWVVKLLTPTNPYYEFHFINNMNQNYIKRVRVLTIQAYNKNLFKVIVLLLN